FARRWIEVLAGRDAATIDRDQLRLERFASAGCQLSHQVPVAGAAKRHAFALALDNRSDGDTLNSAGRKPRPHLAPQELRDVDTVEPVRDPPRFLRSYQPVVDPARVLQGVGDRLFGDLVKYQPADGNLRLEHLAQVPTDGLAFAVFVGRQVEALGGFDRLLQLLDLLLFAA